LQSYHYFKFLIKFIKYHLNIVKNVVEMNYLIFLLLKNYMQLMDYVLNLVIMIIILIILLGLLDI